MLLRAAATVLAARVAAARLLQAEEVCVQVNSPTELRDELEFTAGQPIAFCPGAGSDAYAPQPAASDALVAMAHTVAALSLQCRATIIQL